MKDDAAEQRSDERSAAARDREDLAEIRWLRNWVLYPNLVGVLVLLVLVAIGFESEAQSRTDGFPALALIGIVAAVLLGATLVVERHPVPITLGLALLASLEGIRGLYALLFGEETEWPWSRYVWQSFWALYLWTAFFGALRMSRRVREQPDSYLALIVRGAGSAEIGGHRGRSLDDHRRFKMWERRAILLLFALVAGLLIYAVYRAR